MDFCAKLKEMLGAEKARSFSIGDWHGTSYFILMRNNMFSMSTLNYGTCYHCDWAMQLEDDYGSSPYPESVYEPIMQSLIDQISWQDKESFFATAHMKFGVSLEDQEALENAKEIIEEMSQNHE